MAFAGGFPGKTPRVPNPQIFTKLNAAALQKQALEANIGNLPALGNLGNLYSKEALSQIENILPGYGDKLSATGAAIDSLFGAAQPLLQGQVPPDVEAYVRRQAAQTALSGGYAGSEMGRNLTLRDLGLTSLQGIQQGAQLAGQGLNSLQAWDALARRNTLPMDQFLFTPSQNTALAEFRATNAYNALQQNYNAQAQPNPLHNIILGLTEAYLGSMGGGKMGAMGGGSPSTSAPGPYGSYEGKEGGLLGFGGTPVYRGTPVFNDVSYNPQYAPGSYIGQNYTNPFG